MPRSKNAPSLDLRLTKLLISSSSSFWASCTASSVPITVMSSWSLSSAVGKMILAPVLSRTLRMFPPPFPMRNLWYSGFACSSAVKLFVCCGKNHFRDQSRKKINEKKILVSVIVFFFPGEKRRNTTNLLFS